MRKTLATALLLWTSSILSAAPAWNSIGLNLTSGAGQSNGGAENALGYGVTFQRSFSLSGLPRVAMGPSLSYRQWQSTARSDDTLYTSDTRSISLGSVALFAWNDKLSSGLRYELGRGFGKTKVDQDKRDQYVAVEVTGYEGLTHFLEAPTVWRLQEKLFVSVAPFLMFASLQTKQESGRGQAVTAVSNGIRSESSDANDKLSPRSMSHQVYGISLGMGAIF